MSLLPRAVAPLHGFLVGTWALLGVAVTGAPGCATVDGDGMRRQEPLGDDITDRAIVDVRWRKTLRRHGIFTYLPEEYAGAGSSHGGSRIYVGTGDGRLRCMNAHTGRPMWEVDLGSPVTSPPLVLESLGMLYVGAGDGALHAVDLKTGKARWLYRTKGISYQPAVYSDGVVYFTNDRDQVFSLDAKAGDWRWSYDREIPQSFTVAGHGAPVVDGQRILVGFSDGTLVCLGARGGETQWTRSLAARQKEYVDVDATPIVHRGVVYASSYSGGMYAVTLDGGALRWRYPVRGASSAAVAGDRLYFVSSQEGIHSMDLEGRLRWRQRVEGGNPQTPRVRGRALFVTLSEGGLYIVDRVSGRLMQRFNPGGGVSSAPLLTRDSLYLLSNQGQLFALTLQ